MPWGHHVPNRHHVDISVVAGYTKLTKTVINIMFCQLSLLSTPVIIIIIIIDFYGAYILRNLSSEAQQNRISRRNRKQGRAKVSKKYYPVQFHCTIQRI